jgi:single-strand DNA-binding protein
MNKVMLIGNVGKDPDIHYYDADQSVAQVSLATTERGYTLQNGTKVPDHTDWHNLVFYRGLAKVVEKYVHKGEKLYIEGRLRYRNYNDQQGRHHNVTEIIVDNMEMLSGSVLSGQDQSKHEESSPSAITHPKGEGQEELPF